MCYVKNRIIKGGLNIPRLHKSKGDSGATKSNKITLDGKKRKLIDFLTNPECQLTITAMCHEVGISRSTFYDWLSNDKFIEFLNKKIDNYANSELSAVWKALITKAKYGDVQAIKLYFEMLNKYKQKVELSGNVVFIAGEDDIPD